MGRSILARRRSASAQPGPESGARRDFFWQVPISFALPGQDIFMGPLPSGHKSSPPQNSSIEKAPNFRR